MNFITRLIPLTPLGIIFCLLALVGISLFIMACWRNIKRSRHEDNNDI